MNRTVKHITAIILLLILPLSAIGLDVTIHKCQHKGTYHLTVFDSSEHHSNKDCCCSGCGMNKTNHEYPNSSKKSESSNNGEKGAIYYNAPCCTNFELSNDISIQLFTISITKDNFDAPLIICDIFQSTNINLLNNGKVLVKDIQFPLKGPIDYIISFIQTTALSADEADVIS